MSTGLRISKEDFRATLEQRIAEGHKIQAEFKALKEQSFTNAAEQFEKLEKVFRKWDSYNSEWLEHAFTIGHNKYLSSYENANEGQVETLTAVSTGADPDSLQFRFRFFGYRVNPKVEELEILLEKIALIPISAPAPALPLKKTHADSQPQASGSTTTMQKVFISHASADKAIASELVELLELIGVPSDKIFYSSSPEYGITPGEDFLARIKSEISGQTLVLFAMSKQFLNSHVCLCEMGAAWVLSQLHIPVVIPPFSFGDIRGVIPLTQGTTINDPQQINAFAKRVAEAFDLPLPLQNPTWERKRDRILNIINEQLAREAEAKRRESRSSSSGKSDGLIGGIQF